MSSVDSILKSAESKMAKAVEVVQHEFSTVRTGKASPELVSHLTVDAYGSAMKLKEVAGVTTPDPRTLVIQPWDVGLVEAVSKALQQSRLGITPHVEGKAIYLRIPELSQDRRKELVAAIGKVAEEGRVSVRTNRRHAIDELKKAKKDGALSEDELATQEKAVQKLTDSYIAQIDKAVAAKEAELMKV